MAAKTFYLTLKSGPEAGLRVKISGRSFLIGRDTSADLVIDDIEVSRRHARLIAQSGGYVIEDMGSTNGTFINGQRLTTMLPLSPGATVGLGDNITLAYSVEISDEADTDPVLPVRSEVPPSQAAPIPPVQPLPEAPRQPRPPVIPDPEPLAPAPMAEPPASEPPRRAERPRRASVFGNPWVVGCGVLIFLGILAGIAFLWYVDANFLWCDVFGGLIPACR